MEINTFTEKLNKISGRVYVIEEHVNLKQGYMRHCLLMITSGKRQ